MRSLIPVVFTLIVLRAEVIDRLAITVGNQVITELQVDEELRVSALLNHKPVQRDLSSKRDAADRLIEQFLVKREIDLSHYPMPTATAIDAYVEQVQEDFGGADRLARALHDFDLSQATLRDHLILQLTSLSYIEYRFRSDLSVTDADIVAYYKRQVADAHATHAADPPSFEASKDSIRQSLIAERTDEALNSWLEEARKQFNIVYVDRALQ